MRKIWTQEEFFAWSGHGEGRYEFDGFEPVAMTGGTINHALIMRGLHRALEIGLRGHGCQPLGPDAGVATIGTNVRYPDALITCGKLNGRALIVPDVAVGFEVVSPSSGRTDRIIKVREYASVPTIRRYVMVESTSAGLTVLERETAGEAWRATTLTAEDILRMPEIGIEVAVAAVYQDVSFSDEAGAGAEA